LDLETLKEATEESASIMCGDWLRRIRPVIKNTSKRSSKYWARLEEIVEERYKRFLKLSPIERLKIEPTKDSDLCKEEYASKGKSDYHGNDLEVHSYGNVERSHSEKIGRTD
jgi:hypothetical protein